MAKRRFGTLMLLLFFCFCALPCAVLAASTTEAKEPVSVNEDCTLTVYYGYNGTAFPNQTIRLYRVADVSADFQYTLAPAFAASDLTLNGIRTNGEWDVIRSTLENHILATGVAPTATTITDNAGNACFEGLKPGLYLTSTLLVEQGGAQCVFAPALVALPGLGEDGYWDYQVAVAAKPGILPPAEPDEAYQVVKLWKGDEGRADRPKSIQVELFRNGVRYETVTLSAENQWSYSWPVDEDGAVWNVVERVPTGYTMTVQQRGTTFVLTNTRQDTPTPTPPQTGDTTNMLLYTVLLYVSGAMLIILGITGKRKRNEETNETVTP